MEKIENTVKFTVGEQTNDYLNIIRELDILGEKFVNLININYGRNSEFANKTFNKYFDAVNPARDILLEAVMLSIDENLGKKNPRII
ncbi:hypothetical protein TRIP_D440226 [uncultured Paludibacter sp.]|nr:hypothetical protein TRIP_D440226 [uncultured Paludibacter sp.]